MMISDLRAQLEKTRADGRHRDEENRKPAMSMLGGMKRSSTGGVVPLKPISATDGLAASSLKGIGYSGEAVTAVKHRAAAALKIDRAGSKPSSPAGSSSRGGRAPGTPTRGASSGLRRAIA